MSIVLYDLAGRGDVRFSPNCWRSRMALAHKGLDHEARATTFTQIGEICGGGQKSIPVIEDGGETVADSWEIAKYLDRAYPDKPRLINGEGETRLINYWVNTALHPGLANLIIADVYDSIDEGDREYFRESREKLFGKKLEDIQQGRDERVAGFAKLLTPLRMTLKEQAWIGGERPSYADYLPFGALQWARTTSPVKLLEADDPVADWFERCLDLHDGLGRTAAAKA